MDNGGSHHEITTMFVWQWSDRKRFDTCNIPYIWYGICGIQCQVTRKISKQYTIFATSALENNIAKLCSEA